MLGSPPRGKRAAMTASTAPPTSPDGVPSVLVLLAVRDGADRIRDCLHGLATQSHPRVGVLDSSRFASLRPGYWMTFTGRYQSEAEATGSLRRARAAVKGARVQRIEP